MPSSHPRPCRRHSLASAKPMRVRRPARRIARLVAVVALLCASSASAQLSIGIETHPATAAIGDLVETTVTVTNQGAGNVSGIDVQLDLPSAIEPFALALVTTGASALQTSSCNGGTSGAVCEGGEALLWSMAAIDAGGSTSMTVPTRIAAGAGATLGFTTSLSVSNVLTLQANSEVDVSGDDLVLALAETHDPVAAGGQQVYTLHYGNRSTTDTATDVVLALPVPSDTSFVSATGGGGLSGGQVEWSLGDLPPGETGSRTATFTVSPSGLPDGSLLVAQATLSDATLPASRVAHATAITEVDGDEALSFDLELRGDASAPGDLLLADLTVANRGVANRSTISIHLRLPDGLDAFDEALIGEGSAVVAGDACNGLSGGGATCEGGEFIRWSMSALDAGQSTTVQLPMFVATDLAPGELLAFSGYTSDSGNRDERAAIRRSVAVDATDALELSLDDASDPVEPGQRLDYVLQYGNPSASATASAVSLSMPVPEGLSFVSATGGGVASGGRVSWALGDLLPGESGRVVARFDVDGSGLPDGTLLRAEADLVDDSTPSARRARATTTTEIDATDPFALAFETSADPAAPGDLLVAELTLTNRSTLNRGSPALYLRLPAGLEPFSEALLGTGSAAVGSDSCNGLSGGGALCESGEFIRWSTASLAAGQSTTVQIPLIVAPDAPDGAVLGFSAYATDSGNVDERASVRRSVSVAQASRLALTLDDDRDPVAPGDDLVYTLHLANPSASVTATATTLSLQIPDGLGFVAATDGGAVVGDRVEWSVGDLPPGWTGSRSVTFAVPSTGLEDGSLLQARADLSEGTAPVGQGVRAWAATEVDADEALSLDLTLTPEVVLPGEPFTVSLTLTNQDVVNSNSLALHLRIPGPVDDFAESDVGVDIAALSADSCDGLDGGGAICEPGEFVKWSVTSLAPGQSTTVEVPMTLSAGTAPGGLHAVWAYASDTGSDDDRVSAHRTVPEPDLLGALALGGLWLCGHATRRPGSGAPDGLRAWRG